VHENSAVLFDHFINPDVIATRLIFPRRFLTARELTARINAAIIRSICVPFRWHRQKQRGISGARPISAPSSSKRRDIAPGILSFECSSVACHYLACCDCSKPTVPLNYRGRFVPARHSTLHRRPRSAYSRRITPSEI